MTSAKYEYPVITDTVLDQWWESAQADAVAEKTWSTSPLAILALVAEVRAARKSLLVKADEEYADLLKATDDVLASMVGLHGAMSRLTDTHKMLLRMFTEHRPNGREDS